MPKKHKRPYRHLTQADRDRLQALRDEGVRQKEVAKILKVDPATISREIKRNRRKYRKKKYIKNKYARYEADVAEHKAYVRRKYAKYQGKKINENEDLKQYIIRGLKRFWSPDEISGKMKKERRALIPHRISISMRPLGATNKTRYGHYEGDTMVSAKKTGSKAALSVVYERKSKYIDARKIKNLKPASNNAAIEDMKKEVFMKSLSMDNGIENTKYEELGVPAYFCDRYSSWQKGGVEHANKMIRRFIPKKSDLADYSEEYVKMVIDILNNKPRKSLNYKTAYEVMVEHNLLQDNKKTEVALRG